jgi:hypothetical protein
LLRTAGGLFIFERWRRRGREANRRKYFRPKFTLFHRQPFPHRRTAGAREPRQIFRHASDKMGGGTAPAVLCCAGVKKGEREFQMRRHWIGAALAAGFVMTLASSLSAQQRQVKPQPDPDLNAEDQLSPSQMAQPMPGAVAAPSGAPRHAAAEPTKRAAPAASAAAATVRSNAAIAASRTVVCGGPFSKDSSNLKLAMVFDSRNVTFEDVDVGGTKVGASILFPKDPKRRLEIWWQNPGNRSGIYLVLINGQSTWSAPAGLKLGLTLAELEKLNRKPFKLKGFDKDGTATVSDWDDGALAKMPGDCKSGVSLKPDPKASADAVKALTADKEYSSSDPLFRELKPKVSEILIGY